jgi:hypothetical protein
MKNIISAEWNGMESRKKISRGRIQRKTWCMGPYAGVYYNLTLCPLQRRLQHIYQWLPYARVDTSPMPESILFPSQWLWFGLRFDFGIGGKGCGVGGGDVIWYICNDNMLYIRKKIRSPGPILNDLDWSFFPQKKLERKSIAILFIPRPTLFAAQSLLY